MNSDGDFFISYRTVEEIKTLVWAFEERILPKDEWTHAAHLTVGLYYSLNFSPAVALILMRVGIRRLNDAHDTPNADSSGYHKTLTVFWLSIIEEFVGKAIGDSIVEMANLLTASLDSKLPLEFYSREFLFSAQARVSYVEPDLRKLSKETENVSSD